MENAFIAGSFESIERYSGRRGGKRFGKRGKGRRNMDLSIDEINITRT